MAQSSQDMEEFLDLDIEIEEPLPTRIARVPNCVTKATLTEIEGRSFLNNRTNEYQAVVELTFTINDDEVKEETGLDEPKAKMTIYLDTIKGWNGRSTPQLDFGRNKNVQMGRVLKGFGINNPRKFKWNSLKHEDAWVRIVEPNNEESPFSTVSQVGMEKFDVQTAADRKREAAEK